MTIACLGWGSLIWDPRDLLLGSAWREDGPQLLLQVVEELRDVRKGREMLRSEGVGIFGLRLARWRRALRWLGRRSERWVARQCHPALSEG